MKFSSANPFFLVLSGLALPAAALNDGIAMKPQMGFNTWNSFKATIDESVMVTAAEKLVSLGLKDVGYIYANMDEGWQANYTREETGGKLLANSTRFPNGIKHLADRIHDLGLKVGIYSDAGVWSCFKNPGSYGYEYEDAQDFAAWGIDYLKYDNCAGAESYYHPPQVRFGEMRDALKSTGREILFSLCEWGYMFPWLWSHEIGHSYRMSGDIYQHYTVDKSGCRGKTAYSLTTGDGGCSVLTIIRKMREITQYQQPGSWADMDMLEIGNVVNATVYEEQTHFSYWAVLKSPLIIGANLATISNSSVEILKNTEIIALNQDDLTVAPWYIASISIDNNQQYWAGPLSDGWVVLMTNELKMEQDLTIKWGDIDGLPAGDWRVRDIWEKKDLGVKSEGVTVEGVKYFQTKVLRLTKEKR
ncbi:glycoside hydrolase superfamily [Morchella snyderi]|nr:glycoside hydrolase superfamily [Morchella snyderi]